MGGPGPGPSSGSVYPRVGGDVADNGYAAISSAVSR